MDIYVHYLYAGKIWGLGGTVLMGTGRERASVVRRNSRHTTCLFARRSDITSLKFLSWRNLRRWRTADVGRPRFLAKTRLYARLQTSVSPGGEEGRKGEDPSLSHAAKYWSAREIQRRRSIRPGAEIACSEVTHDKKNPESPTQIAEMTEVGVT